MINFLSLRSSIALLFAVLWIAVFTPPPVVGQTLEIQQEIDELLEDQSWLRYLKSLWRSAELLSTELDATELRNAHTFKDALGILGDQFQARGIELEILINSTTLREERPDSWYEDCPMDLSRLPTRSSLSRGLMEMLDQLPQKNATVVVRRQIIEFTTVEAAGRRGWNFHLARRIAPTLRLWFWTGVACATAFLMIRGWTTFRGSPNQWCGVLSVAVRTGLVGLFWPAWVLGVVIGFFWRLRSAAPGAAIEAAN